MIKVIIIIKKTTRMYYYTFKYEICRDQTKRYNNTPYTRSLTQTIVVHIWCVAGTENVEGKIHTHTLSHIHSHR